MKNVRMQSQNTLLRDLVDRLQHQYPVFSVKKHRQVLVDVDEIRKNLKASWKDGGHCDTVFGKLNPLRGKTLSPWQLQRMPMSKRSYSSPKTFKGIKTDPHSRAFTIREPQRIYSEKFLKYIGRVESQYEDKLFSPKRQEKNNSRYKKMHTQTMKFSTGSNFFGLPQKISKVEGQGFSSIKSEVLRKKGSNRVN